MGFLDMAGDIISGGVGIVGSGINAISQAKTNKINKEIAEKNLQLQRDNFEYQKQIQKEIMLREDNAVQRRAEDLNKAGINRLMAAGQGANAGSVVQTTAPQQGITEQPVQISTNEALDRIYNTMRMRQDINMSKTQQDLIRAQIISELEKPKNITADTQGKLQETKNKVLDNVIREYDYNKSRGMGLRTNEGVPKTVEEALIRETYGIKEDINNNKNNNKYKKQEPVKKGTWKKGQSVLLGK